MLRLNWHMLPSGLAVCSRSEISDFAFRLNWHMLPSGLAFSEISEFVFRLEGHMLPSGLARWHLAELCEVSIPDGSLAAPSCFS